MSVHNRESLEHYVSGPHDHDSGKRVLATQTAVEGDVEAREQQSASDGVFNSKRALWGFLVLCFSTGPVSGMSSTYASAAILSAANVLGHQAGTNKPCPRRGTNINCVVKFGTGEIDYASYTLYLRAISRATEGVLAIITAGIADYCDYRKTMMMTSIFLFGILALPFAGLTGQSYSHLTALSVLYCALTTVQGIYTVIEGSYIPIFMRSTGWFRTSVVGRSDNSTEGRIWQKGVSVSVLALVSSNVGALAALIIGIILVYGRGSYVAVGYFNYLLAITIAGCMTILFAILGHWLLPNVQGKKLKRPHDVLTLPIRNWVRLIRHALRYSEAFKLCIGWVLWNTGYSNHLSIIGSLFLQVTGISRSSGVYSVWSFMSVILACVGSLSFMFLYPRVRLPVKAWAYTLLVINILCVLWGCIGMSPHVTIGYKHGAEFWVEQVLFMSTSSALRAYNRAIYSSLIPRNAEAQFFGLEITLDLATGWINPLVMGVIQNRTHNLRFPMIPNLLLMLVALGFYYSVDMRKGIDQARIPLEL